MRHLLIMLTLTAAGCSYLPEMPLLGEASPPPETTLADLQPVALEAPQEEVPQRSLRELEAAYREVLDATGDPALQLKVRRRLADLEMMATESEGLGAANGGVLQCCHCLLPEPARGIPGRVGWGPVAVPNGPGP